MATYFENLSEQKLFLERTQNFGIVIKYMNKSIVVISHINICKTFFKK